MTASGLYIGLVTHRRLRPRPHRLRYRVFQCLFDLDEIDSLATRLTLFSRNRFNLFGFRDRDFGDGSATPLRAQIEGHLRAAGLGAEGGAIRLLAMPRILGHVFNPLSVWFCHARDGRLQALIYEVTNTFRERHLYLIPVAADAGAAIRQRCNKNLYVSPFLDMGLSYTFTIRPPGAEVAIGVEAGDADGPLLFAAFAGKRRELSDGALARAFLRHPLLTLKVVAGIHVEALILWAKGVGVRRHPPAPAAGLTIVSLS